MKSERFADGQTKLGKYPSWHRLLTGLTPSSTLVKPVLPEGTSHTAKQMPMKNLGRNPTSTPHSTND
ncbi:MAG: hypothetical protein HOA75_13375 [Deltaproteobacteria bacterium]|nr:hypothetical protein [Deltaproteobacteria bacterium]